MDEMIRPHLLDGERLLWTGQGERKLFGAVDLFYVPFTLVWAGFAFFWEYTVVTKIGFKPGAGPVGLIFPLFGLPFVVVGLYITVGRFWYKEWRRQRTFYALTSRRVLILNGRHVQSLSLDALPVLELSEDANTGLGTLRFGQTPFLGGLYTNTGMEYLSPRYNVPAFANIPDARQVYALVEQARRQASAR